MAEIRLDNIQGNILGGFNKDYQAFLLFQIPDAASGQAWLANTVGDVAASEQVVRHNRVFKTAKQRLGGRDPVLTGLLKPAIWLNLAFTHRGLARLGVSRVDLDAFPEEFREGMRARAELLGDVDESAPEKWIAPLRGQDVHGILLVAADHAADCNAEVRRQQRRLDRHGLTVLYAQLGNVREGAQKGHEHFGFKDGISQPGIRGVPVLTNRRDPNQGDPGQDLIQPGEFVLGYPTTGSPAAVPSPAWAADGSYLVFRRLKQNVQGFRRFVEKQAETQRIPEDVMGAKLIGRYASGAPLERTKDQAGRLDPTLKDPSRADPRILDDARINNFGFGDDPDGSIVPRAAHIRKVYPRDQAPPGEDEANSHRLLRRGIPFGESYQERAPAESARGGNASFPNDRGLLFLCYQSSIARQFEYVQQKMVNNPDFPRPGDGKDPLISQDAATREFALPGGIRDHITLMQRWVTTTGGDYFFSPSISALHELAAGQGGKRSTAMPYNSEYMKSFAQFVVAVWSSKHPASQAPEFPTIGGGVGAPPPLPDAERVQQLVNHAVDAGKAHRERVITAIAAKTDGTQEVNTAQNKASDFWKLALAAFNIDPRPGRKVIVHQNSSEEFHYVIPEPPATNPSVWQDLAVRALETLECDQ